jgi:apolipoprotein N-acyltransferase
VARYKKRSLVIFGEYIPLTRWLPFLKWFTPIQEGFTPGDRPVEFEMTISRETNPPARHESASAKEAGGPDTDDFLKPPLRVRTSPLICFEDIFAPLARECAGLNVDFLVNLTNDGWFGESAAHWQHAAAALFRAVENDLPLIRCTNNGLTCWFDSKGRLRGLFMDNDGNVHGAGFMRVSLPLPDAGAKPPPTFYHEHGDWFGWGCGGLAVLALLSLRHKGRD